MKDNLELKKFERENINGSFNLFEQKTFFNSKIMDIEDNIIIDDKSIQYYQVIDDNEFGIGYQYKEMNQNKEGFILFDMINTKKENHIISLLQQSDVDKMYNTKWSITINVKNILREYLFSIIKKQRTFKSIKSENFINKNINQSIYTYIDNNLLDRYEISQTNLYVKYYNIKNNDVFVTTLLKQYNPLYDGDIKSDDTYVKNINIIQNNLTDSLANIIINYSQTKPSTEYKFDYYYEIIYKKI